MFYRQHTITVQCHRSGFTCAGVTAFVSEETEQLAALIVKYGQTTTPYGMPLHCFTHTETLTPDEQPTVAGIIENGVWNLFKLVEIVEDAEITYEIE